MSVLGLNPLVALEVACGAPSCPGSLLTLWSIRSWPLRLCLRQVPEVPLRDFGRTAIELE